MFKLVRRILRSGYFSVTGLGIRKSRQFDFAEARQLSIKLFYRKSLNYRPGRLFEGMSLFKILADRRDAR